MRNKSILLVDDVEIILHALGTNLRHENYDVTLASSGEEALSLLQDNPFDLVVTDLSMPGIDGTQVLKEAKKINPMTGVIILTGYGDTTSAYEALRLGADDYVLKSCESDELIMRIQRCLEKQYAFQKVKFYENILPVCVYCKKIRDDVGTEHGKGKWLRMEEYIRTKSESNNSHDCCPVCYEKHKDD